MKNRVFLMVSMTLALFVLSCNNQRNQTLSPHANSADSMLFDLGVQKQYQRMLVLTDSFEMEGALSMLDANRWRGVAYYHQGQYRMAEICYEKALDCQVKSEEDQVSYNKSARRLSELLLIKGDYEGALSIAVPAVKKMDESGIGSDIDYAILLTIARSSKVLTSRNAATLVTT